MVVLHCPEEAGRSLALDRSPVVRDARAVDLGVIGVGLSAPLGEELERLGEWGLLRLGREADPHRGAPARRDLELPPRRRLSAALRGRYAAHVARDDAGV